MRNQLGGNPIIIRKHIDNKNVKNINQCIKFIKSNKFNAKEIGKGLQGHVFIVENEECGTIVIKHYNNSNAFFKEKNALIKLKKLIINNICPNFIFMYNFDKIKNNIYLEYIDNDIKHFYDNFKVPITTIEFKSLIFQIAYGLLCQYELCNIKHYDTQTVNIFIKRIDKNIIFCYNINNKKYFIPTCGKLFMLGDYGLSIFIKI
jgi:hypothetical protein